jgi:hypothetical protein
MYDEQELLKILKDRGIVATGRIAEDIFQEANFFVFVEVIRNSENHQIPSNKTLNETKKYLKDEGVNVEFILTDAAGQDIEAGFRASILHSFGDFVRNAFLTVDGTDVGAWISPKTQIELDILSKIEEKTRVFLSNYDLNLSRLEYTSAANLPGKFFCLQMIRLMAPVKLDELTNALRQKRFTVPSENWMSRMLDSLRKGGFVFRRKSGDYVLTLAGLKALGTLKNGRSPDIVRMLALARSGD